MSAREEIAARLWMSVPSADNDEAKARTEEMLDAYRAEVLNEGADAIDAKQDGHEAEERKRFGNLDHETRLQADATRDAAALLRQIADGQNVDTGFFQRNRIYTRTLRTGIHSPTPIHLRFVCVSLTSDPKIGDREAWGWLRRSDGTRRREFLFDHDYPNWTPEAGDGRG